MGAKLLLLALFICASKAQDQADASDAANVPDAANAPAGVDCSADKNNGFELSECGNDKMKVCCHPTQQVCLSGTPKGGDEKFECSTNRALYGMKVVRVLIIPIYSCVFLLAAFIIMVRPVKNVRFRPPLALLCMVQTLLAILVVFSPMWKFALYSAFVAVIVFYMMKVKGNRWVFLAIIALQIFNLVAAIGAYGTTGTFVPLGLLSADNVKSWETGMIDYAGSGCSAYYGNFFNVENVDFQHEGADPLVKFQGYCSDTWLATVVATIAAKAVIQLFMLVLSTQLLQNQFGGQESDEMKAMESDEMKAMA